MSRGANNPPSTRLYIKVPNLTEAQLTEAFSKYGEIADLNPLQEYSFVEFKNQADAETAMVEMNGSKLNEQDVVIEYARPKRDKAAEGAKAGCFNCGSSSHWARDCPQARDGPICWRCQSSGHLAKDCTRPMRSRSRSPYGRDRYRRSPSPRRYGRSPPRGYRSPPRGYRSPPRGYRSPPRGYPPRGYSPRRDYARSRSPPYRGGGPPPYGGPRPYY